MEKLSYKTLFTIVIILLVGIVFLLRIRQKPQTVSAAWYNTNWTRRLALTIDHTKVTADQTDFPVYINLANLPADFHSHVNQTDARDIRVTKADGTTELPREVVFYNSSTDSGELYFKYTGTLSSTNDTQIFIYYGNSSATNPIDSSTYGKFNVWDSNFVGVWHLNEVGTTRYDSTSNGNHLAVSGTVGSNTTGKIGTASDFTQAGNLFRTDANLTTNFPSKNGQTTTDMSFSFWVRPDTLGILDWLGKESNDGWYFYDTTDDMAFSYYSGAEVGVFSSAGSVTTGNWSYIVGVHNNSADTDTIYVNGSSSGNATGRTGNPDASDAAFRLGGTDSWPTEADGLIDEVRVSITPRSSTWISTEHNNQNSPSTFFKSSMPTESSNAGPIIWYKFDENTGTTANNSINSINVGTLAPGTSLPTWTTGKFNSALSFDGNNDYVSIGTSGMTTSAGAVSAWVRPTGLGTDATYAFIYSHRAVEGDGSRIYLWRSNVDRHFYIGLGNSYLLDTGYVLDDSKWYHLAIVWSGANYYAYANGSLVSSGSSSQPSALASSVKVGCYRDGTQCFKGIIDDVKIYDFAPTANQIKNDFNNTSSISISNNTSDPLTNGLVGYWKLNEDGDATRKDYSGNKNDLTESAADTIAQTSGKFGSSADFERGDTEYLEITDANQSGLDLGTSFTISFWMNSESTTGNYEAIVARGDGGEWSYGIGTLNGDGLGVFLDDDGFAGGGVEITTAGSFFTNGTWTYITLTYNGSYLRIYKNGVEQTSGNFPYATSMIPHDSAAPFRVGNFQSQSEYYDGKLDELRVYSRTLSASEIQSLYKYTPGPAAYWKLDEASWTNNCSTSTAQDSSGNDYGLRSCPASTGPTGGAVGKISKAGTFDGSNDYLESTSTDFNFSSQVSLSAWVRPLGTPSGDVYVFDRTNNNAGYSLGWQGNRYPRLRIGNSSVYTEVTSSNAMTIGTWYHLAATLDSTGVAKLYVNGNYDTGATNVTLATSTGQNLRLGSRAAVNTISGQIDEARIYDYAITQKQVVSDMNQGSPISTKTTLVHLKFNEGTGTTAFNSSSTVQNGVLGTGTSSPTWTKSGKNSDALSFDGNDYVQIADNSNLDITGDFTISAWVARSGGTNEYIVSKTDASNDGGYALLIGNAGEVYCRTDSGAGYNDSYSATGFVLSDSSWHHLAAVRSGTSCRVYIDGIDRTNTVATHTTLGANAKNLRIGTQPAGGNFTVGKIDEVKIYNHALTATEIKTDYNASSTIQLGQTNQTIGATTTSLQYCIPGDTSPCSTPIAEWKFDQNTGAPSAINDTSGNNNNGTAFGSMTSRDWVPGKIGTALRFDGTDDYVNAYTANLASSFDGNIGTATAWFKLGDGVWSDGVQRHVFTFGADANNQVYFRKATDGTLASIYTAAATNETSLDCAPNDQGYIFMAISWDQTAGNVVHYCNGVLTDIDTALGAWTGALNSTRATIGQHTTGGSFRWIGAIDEVKLYNYVRSPAQVALDYNRGEPTVWYKFDECQGSILHNSMGTGYTGAITIGSAGSQNSLGTCQVGTSAAWTNGASGKINGSLHFDGNDDLVSVTEAESKGILDVGSSDSLSVAFWFNPTSMPASSTYATYAGKNNGGNGWYSQLYSDGSIEFCVVNTNVHCYQSDQKYVTAGSWHHYAVTFTSGNDDSIKLYHNGNLLTGAWTGVTNTTIPNTNDPLVFGSNGDSTEEANGKIDDFRYYNYPLTQTQIKSIINNGSVTFR